MTSINSLAEAEALLASYIPLAKEITGKNITLERMEKLMSVLGNPQDRLKIIHIAGTSGKTSTAYFISMLLTVANQKTGLTVSPHVDSVLERIQINSQVLSEEEFTSSLSKFVTYITESGIEPTYFELLVAYAYGYFDEAKVNYAVIETGMGGLQDGTNVADSPDKVCVITDIGLDHMHVLGNTVTQITRQKAGIIHPQNVTLTYHQSDEIMQVLTEHCDKMMSHLRVLEEEALAADKALPQEIDLLPDFQKRNWLLAYETYKAVAARDNLLTLNNEQLAGTMKIQVPGRMEFATVNDKTIVMDGAHNEQKTQTFVSSLSLLFPGKKFPVLLSLKEGKEFAAVLPLLKPVASKLIITAFDTSQDLHSVSIDPSELAKAAERFGFEEIITEPDHSKAYDLLLACEASEVIITGSFYLLGQLRRKHPELKNAEY